MLPILLGLLAPTSHAEAVIEFKTKAPVHISVGGRQATLQQNLRQRVAGLEAGVHALKVQSMFGKTLYEAEIELPDNTLTTAAWERGQITVLSTDWLEEEDEEPEPEPDVPAPPVAQDVIEVPPAVPEPIAPTAEPVAEALPAATVPAPIAEEATTLPSSAKTRTLEVQASEGMRIEVAHEGRTVTVVVERDGFRIIDASGMELALGTE